MPKRITDFSEIEAEFVERAHAAVWCSVATVDTQNRPRSRVLHPIWEGQTGWIAVNRHSPKSKHLAANPYMSLAYVADPLKPVYAECKVIWMDDQATKERIWNLFKDSPEPLGYDPGLIWQDMQNPTYGLLQLQPWLVRLYDIADQTQHRVWQSS